MACNLIYIHLLARLEHSEKCTEQACAHKCGFVRFEDWLNAPLLPADFRRDERLRERAEALMRGEIPT